MSRTSDGLWSRDMSDAFSPRGSECGCRPGTLSWEGRSGDLLVVPDARHSLEALEASAVLLTVAKLP